MTRIYLSPPHTSGDERRLLLEAFDSNWVAPLGPHVDAFEQELAARCRMPCCAALSSGTGGLHLALLLLGVGSGDEVWTSTLTFSATANAITYVGARPVFVDADRATWNLDPALLAQALDDANQAGRLPKAVIPVDLYGQSADWEPILAACKKYQIPVIEDAAEALGATYHGNRAQAEGVAPTGAPDELARRGKEATGPRRPDESIQVERPCGSFGDLSVLSFNGNKIITTGGGGALLSPRREWIDRARFLATQARDPAPHYQHSSIGYNYRLSNLLAAVGRGQLLHLDERIAARRANKAAYRRSLAELPGIELMPDAGYGVPTNWLTCILVDAKAFGADREAVRKRLESLDIEARPVWKPMHLQPVFRECRAIGGAVAADLFERGLCLPSGSSLLPEQRQRIIEVICGLQAKR
ncbi:MAG: aminotransferase class I/II-fold pyridoxal phosphate-dependent enzyme [Deltaproteobacteria bacterium]|nr:aminotransferase class I/II-fold pyridoxal phosphate-dependent enzyme [Deltaproteobacteria bacterium]